MTNAVALKHCLLGLQYKLWIFLRNTEAADSCCGAVTALVHTAKDLTAPFNVVAANDNPFFHFTSSDLAIDMTRRISSTECYLCLYCFMTMRHSMAAIAVL